MARHRSPIKDPGAMIAVEPAPRATGVDERDVPSAAIEILPERWWLVGHMAGVGCARCAPDIFLRRAAHG